MARKYFGLMCAVGICSQSGSPWSSGLHLVSKKDRVLRPCGDYRHLNSATIWDNYRLPHVHDCNSKLSGPVIFSMIDLLKEYHQIPLSDSDVQKTAIATWFGLFQFLRMPFGLKNSAQTFQSFRILVPWPWRQLIFQAIHDPAHSHYPGRAMLVMATRSYVWYKTLVSMVYDVSTELPKIT